MKNLLRTLLLSSFAVTTLSADEEPGFVPLFDGKTLEGWKSAKSKGEGDFGPFSVNTEEKAIHVYSGQEQGSKQANDCLVSEKQFSHYVLRLEYKWLENRFSPRRDWDRDAGLLYHVHGDLTKVWPLSLEMQIGESPGDKTHGKGNKGRFHTGDLFVLDGQLMVDVSRSGKFYDPKAPLKSSRHCPTRLGIEKPIGEWNQIEIRVDGSNKATYLLNGDIVFELQNFRRKNDSGKSTPLKKGHLGLQAEWAEILYRDIRIKELPSE